MDERRMSRRSLLATGAIAGATALGVGGVASATANSEWVEVDSPTGNALYDTVFAAGESYAVGSGGNVLRRGSDGWTIVVADGVTGDNKTLHACDTTNDGKYLWMCGSSGRVGYYDLETGTMQGYTSPVNNGTTYNDVVAWGRSGKERVYLATSSGRVVVGTRDSSGAMQWHATDTGGGYTVNGIDFYERKKGHAVTNGEAVYATKDGGETWDHVGIEFAQVPLNDVVSRPDHVYVVGGSGQLYRGDRHCTRWTPFSPGSKELSAIVHNDDGEWLGCGGSGRALRKQWAGWGEYQTPVGLHLNGCTLGSPDVVVGDSGTILERK